MKRPSDNKDPLYLLLRDNKIEEFNTYKAAGKIPDLREADLRGLDLRGMDVAGLDMTNCYLRQTDLRGIDFTQARIEGASINSAKISGCLFPKELTAEEITLSLLHGTRLRYK